MKNEDMKKLNTNTVYLTVKKEAEDYWNRSKCSGAALSRKYDLHPATACRWIIQWKANKKENRY